MIEIYEVLFLLIIHYISDFIFQDHKWGENKSKNNTFLIKHTITYSMVFFMLILPLVSFYHPELSNYIILIKSIYFSLISFTFHTIIDYITSRVVSYKIRKKQFGTSIPNRGVFSVIGFDQVLHYIQIFITYNYLFLK